jgi:multidrug efflux pump subunit AcrB
MSGLRYAYFNMNGKQYQVIGQVDRENRDDPADLTGIYVRNNKGQLIQLDNVVKKSEPSSPPQLYRYNRYVSATMSAGLAPGRTMGEGLKSMYRIASHVLNPSFSTELAGPARDYAESSSNFLYTLLLAILLIYLVLAAQFESFTDPLIIICTFFPAFAGAVFSLWYFNQTWNIFSQIGIVMLVGLVAKNGILIVEFSNHLREEGQDKITATINAAAGRLRPILMTNLATSLGALPIALALGSGAVSRVGMGIVVMGGILISVVLTLFVIPAIYTYLSRKKRTTHETSQHE